MQMYQFLVTDKEIYKDGKELPRAKAPWELRDLQDFIGILNNRVSNQNNRIKHIATNSSGNLIFLYSHDGRHKEFLAEPLLPDFMNFLLSMMLMHSLGAESPTKEGIQEIYGIKSEIVKKHR